MTEENTTVETLLTKQFGIFARLFFNFMIFLGMLSFLSRCTWYFNSSERIYVDYEYVFILSLWTIVGVLVYFFLKEQPITSNQASKFKRFLGLYVGWIIYIGILILLDSAPFNVELPAVVLFTFSAFLWLVSTIFLILMVVVKE